MSEIQLFNNAEFGAIRAMLDESEEPWFLAKDVCDALGIRTDTVRVILDDDEVKEVDPNSIGVTKGRKPLLVSEPGLYSLVMKSRKPEAKAFKRWITHEVLPAIRKRGAYVADIPGETTEELLARALLAANDAMERQKKRIDSLEKENADMRPKALFADAVSTSDSCMLIGQFAKVLRQNGAKGMGQNRLFAWMRDNGYLGKGGSNRNVPLQKYIEQGLFRVKETAITHSDGHVSVNLTTKLTGKGQTYFAQKFLGAGQAVIEL